MDSLASCFWHRLDQQRERLAGDLGQWNDPANADLKKWYQDLKQPDKPEVLYCGEADAYWADAL
jgi:hypothetical protein